MTLEWLAFTGGVIDIVILRMPTLLTFTFGFRIVRPTETPTEQITASNVSIRACERTASVQFSPLNTLLIICCRVNVTLDMILGVEDIVISWFVIILALLGVDSLIVCCMIHCKRLRLSDANKLTNLLTYLLTYLLTPFSAHPFRLPLCSHAGAVLEKNIGGGCAPWPQPRTATAHMLWCHLTWRQTKIYYNIITVKFRLGLFDDLHQLLSARASQSFWFRWVFTVVYWVTVSLLATTSTTDPGTTFNKKRSLLVHTELSTA